MAEVVLFHSVLGLRPGVTDVAERLRAAGHTVHAPDYYDGEAFDDLDEGMRKEEALGYQEIARRARESVAGLAEGLVFCGFSLGAVHAEVLAASRPGALGAVLMHGAVPVEGLSEFFGVDRWPEGVPLQVHYAALGGAYHSRGQAQQRHTHPSRSSGPDARLRRQRRSLLAGRSHTHGIRSEPREPSTTQGRFPG